LFRQESNPEIEWAFTKKSGGEQKVEKQRANHHSDAATAGNNNNCSPWQKLCKCFSQDNYTIAFPQTW
jgi:hypothetical protein